MENARPAHLSVRKIPRQPRAVVTRDAIFEAAIQVLMTGGAQQLTTTRVAERAGVSVGTMYQYFPNKQALFYALNERYLDDLADRVEAVCFVHHGSPLGQMVAALVSTYWDAKMTHPEVTRALYRAVAEIDSSPLIETFSRRLDAASAAMLASAPDADFPNLQAVTLTLLSTVFGTVRNLFDRNLSSAEAAPLRAELLMMCAAYLAKANRRGAQP